MLELIFSSYWYWLILALALLALEIMLPGIFLFWVGLGAGTVGIFLLLFPQASPAVQLLVLVISMLAAVAAGLKWQIGNRKKKPARINLGMDNYVGKTAVVSTGFSAGQGRVSIDGSSFHAMSTTELSAGEQVVVTKTEGTTLWVEKPAASN